MVPAIISYVKGENLAMTVNDLQKIGQKIRLRFTAAQRYGKNNSPLMHSQKQIDG